MIFLRILIIFFFSINLKADISENNIDSNVFKDYEDILNMIYIDRVDFIQINQRIKELDIKKINLFCTKNKSNAITINLINEENKNYWINTFHINYEDDYNRIFMLLAINSFLYGDSKIKFEYSDFDNHDAPLFRKGMMLEHFRKNYKSFLIEDYKILYEDNVSTLWLKNTKDECIIIGFNNSDSNKQISIDLSEFKPRFALSLLDRSMVEFNAGKANINFSKFETKIFNVKR